jgi:hypothetical protein
VEKLPGGSAKLVLVCRTLEGPETIR